MVRMLDYFLNKPVAAQGNSHGPLAYPPLGKKLQSRLSAAAQMWLHSPKLGNSPVPWDDMAE